MKKRFKGLISAVLTAAIAFSLSVSAFAARQPATFSAKTHRSFLATGDGTLYRWGVEMVGSEKWAATPAAVRNDVAEVIQNSSNSAPLLKLRDGSILVTEAYMLDANGAREPYKMVVNSKGELVSIQNPNHVYLSGVEIKEVYASAYTIVALTADNKLYCIDDKTQTITKVINDVKYVYADYFNHFIKLDGSLWGWGDARQSFWDLSEYMHGDYQVHEPVKLMDSVKMIYDNAIVKTDGTLYTAEWDEYAQKYVLVKRDTNVAEAAAEADAYIYLKNDGTLWGVGYNNDGTFNNGKSTYVDDWGWYVYDIYDTPQLIASNVDSFSFSDTHIMVLKKDGTLWAGGNNYYGQIGDGTRVEKLYHVQVMSGLVTRTAAAVPTVSKVYVDGREVKFDAYHINGNNYFKLRDVASVISGTGKQFEVVWDGEKNAINLISGKGYTAVGGEMSPGDGKSKNTALSTSTIYKDGAEAELTAYNIGGNNYFKLRDLGETFDFDVTWDPVNNAILIDTSSGYTPE